MARVVRPRVAASTTYPPPAIAPQARHLVPSRTTVKPPAAHFHLHRRTSPRTCTDQPHSLEKPRPVRCFVRCPDELLHVHKLMHQHLIAQVEPRSFHRPIAGWPIQQTGDSHEKGRSFCSRPDRPKLAHGGRREKRDVRQRQLSLKQLAVEHLRPCLQFSHEAGIGAVQTTWRREPVHPASASL